MSAWKYIGIIIIIATLLGGAYVATKYAEKKGYCILICSMSKEIAQARADAEEATQRAEDAEERADEAERNTKGISPWVGFLSIALLVLVYLWNETANDNPGNITIDEAERRCKDYLRSQWLLVPAEENIEEGYVRIWRMSGQAVPGSKDSWIYVFSFVTRWPLRMAYPPGWACTTMWMLSTDPDRAQGVIPGMNAMEVYSVFANLRIQKTATPTDIALALDRALTEKKLAETISELRSDGDD